VLIAAAFVGASRAIEFDAESRIPAGGRDYPRTHLKGRLMPHVLSVSAFEIGHPITDLIATKPNDFAIH
jgi:hypothetical protein